MFSTHRMVLCIGQRRYFWPRMFWISSTQFFSNVFVAALPKRSDVHGSLLNTVVGSKQLDNDGYGADGGMGY